ncbi:alpha-glucoside transport system permease protein [Limimaricola soesokkakensis]|uniref:Alpha-glucoside transport system permease protein n=1 Tax=Limimaricola soesokkakensis TaxID=1343159 RepID=A0A1X6ZX05_9RHOB|nr:sugar ABC transporter permease [Limimaricola soesokkakensis]PSK83452.1 alpha-glucoside transport system permease protein [Limimaricola soesokkakensis]SLN63728.1 Lactose transport system permease protein LacF [Limimaricola soesokkakensis]
MNPALQGLLTIVIGVGGCVAYFYFSNILLDKVLFPPRGPNAGRNINRANVIRPWLFLAPALIALGLYLAYPVFETLRLSLTQRVRGGGYEFVGLANYQQMLREPKFWEGFNNNLLWLIVVPAASTAFGLLAAQLTDRIKWGSIAKSLIFMPMAISFVGAAVIFKLIYDTRPAGQEQIGVLNAVWLGFDGGIGSFIWLRLVPALLLLALAAGAGALGWSLMKPVLGREGRSPGLIFGALRILGAVLMALVVYLMLRQTIAVFVADLPYGQPQTWLTIPFWNNFFLMIVLIWIQTGFAMVLLSAALRGIPEETVEAAIVDGANPWQIFFKIKMPQIVGTIVVVWTTITIIVLKVFDIVFAMTNGQWETQVLANYMYDKLFRANDWGVGSAGAMVIMLMVTPILIWNVYNARREMR